MRATLRFRATLLASLTLAGSLIAGCRDATPAAPPIEALGGDCLVNSDCSAPLVCAFQRCHVECVTTRDCDGKTRCVGALEAARVCQLDVEAKCKTSADCSAGLGCAQDGACRDVCKSDADCIGRQLCSAGACAEPSELDANGNLPQTLASVDCRLDSDCGAGSRCATGHCVPECRTDVDCTAGKACLDGACRYPESIRCSSAADCTTKGADCVAGRCECACRQDVDCPAGGSCDGCACQPAASPECSTSQDCQGGKLCLAGKCSCACVTDVDCSPGQACDGCFCVAAHPPSVIHDATVQSVQDIERLQGITQVETTLSITGTLLHDTEGLENIQTVGALVIVSAYGLNDNGTSVQALAGLRGLRVVQGDLRITSNSIRALPFDPALQVGGNVDVHYTSISSCVLIAFEATLRQHGFTGEFRADFNNTCSLPLSCHGLDCYPPVP